MAVNLLTRIISEILIILLFSFCDSPSSTRHLPICAVYSSSDRQGTCFLKSRVDHPATYLEKAQTLFDFALGANEILHALLSPLRSLASCFFALAKYSCPASSLFFTFFFFLLHLLHAFSCFLSVANNNNQLQPASINFPRS
ncbi:hypothetical protein ASPVEDRAFT_571530 [Aspergillus versicolor CBS 583.65]|uniref:Uncharacterized protein n=1 Tax=Aspergillus versicolor CBS 583.65 TaxID=1036611 RepID=A0A1L9PGA6_ASPVE|nr:uncharacterized protein ASPVEDRAFT_571530 [Aspergillus versicolor CBS 583.65]OJJ00485.1 hypothetical protein ASPVEDRAFT_571530 [Aspergillus versicolor CBS 583.65]